MYGTRVQEDNGEAIEILQVKEGGGLAQGGYKESDRDC